jgi:hypothetical protein
MKRIREIGLLILVGVMVFGWMGAEVWAGAAPAIQIDLRLDKQTYLEGEPVGLEVVVTNLGEPLWISEGFGSLVFYYEMRVIDPSGRLLLVKRNEEHIESPDAPPLVSVVHPGTGKIVQVAGCEPLEEGWTSGVQRLADLRTYYDLGLPGYYSVRVQVSVMVFQGEACDINDYEWKGVLQSETKFFYYQASGEGAKVIPDQWKTVWSDPERSVPDVQVQIWPLKGESVKDYDAASIRLNNVAPRRVEVLNSMIKAYFEARAVYERIGSVVVGQWYPVYVSGQKTGGTYYREQKVRVVN